MSPVEPLVTRSNEESDDIHSPSQKNNERNLRKGDPRGTEADTLKVVGFLWSRDCVGGEHDGDGDGIGEDEERTPEGRWCEPCQRGMGDTAHATHACEHT